MPTFGETSILGSTLSIEGQMIAHVVTMGAVSGEADSITFYLDGSVFSSGTLNITCGIYDMSGNLITNGQTEVRSWDLSVSPPADGWYDFNFTGTKPAVTASTQYRLVAWANSVLGSVAIRTTGAGGAGIHYVIETYDGVMDASETFSTFDADGRCSMYCTYTETTSIRQLASTGVGV